MRTKSFILTFLMMMFCSVSFGQNTNPDWGEFNYHDYAMNMEVIAKISLDGEAQTSTSIQVAAYCGNERRSEVMMIKQAPVGGSLVQLQVFGVKDLPTDPNQTQTTEKITFKFYDGTSMFVSNEDMDFKGNHVVGDLFNPFTIEFKSVAKIGDVKYGSLQAAINAAQANDVIVLLADVVAETNPVNIPADVTLNLNAHTIKADIFGTVRTNNGLWITFDDYKMIGKDADIYASYDATVVNTLVNNVNTITIAAGNVTLAATQYDEWWTAQGQELVIGENVTFTIPQGKKFNIESNTSVTINGTVNNEGTLAIKNDATVKGNITGDIHFLGGKYITADNYKMVGTTSDYYYNTTDALVNIAGQFGDITIKSGEMTLGRSWRTVQGQTLTIASGAKFTVPANMTFEVFQNTHVIVNGTLVTDGTVYLQLNATVKAAEGLNVTTNVADHKVVYEGGVYKVVAKVYIAKTETGAKFETLQEAVNAGTTVTLLTSTTGAGVVINKDVTIDFATYTYTINQAVGSSGTETLGFQILKNNTVTLKNGTLTSTTPVVAGKEVKMLIQNYANLTLTDMNLVDNTDHILYALSNNSGNVNLDGKTNITTDKVAFDVCKYASYTEPIVNVNTTGVIAGDIEVTTTQQTNLNISGGTFTVKIEEAWCANGFIPVKNADNTWTVKVGKYVARNTTTGQGYETLVEAVEAAAADQEVKLLANVTLASSLNVNRNVVLELNGYNIESNTIKAIVISNAQLTVNDSENKGVISAPQATLYVAANAKLIVNGGTIEGASAIQGNGSLNGTEVTINGGKIDGKDEIAIYHPQNGVLNINGGTIVGSAGVEMRAGTLNMTDGTVEARGTFATRKHDSGQTVDGVAIALSQHTTNHDVDINITGGTIKSSANGKAFYQDRLTVTYTPSINITADIAATTVEGAVEAAELGYNIVENNGIYSLVYVGFEAQIGEVKYETLVEAVEAAQAGETVTLLKSATGAGVVINKDITIDFNGKTYTVNQAVGSSGTETLGFQILKDNDVTLKKGTLTSTTPVVAGKEVKMLIQNYANLTLTDMNLDDATEHIQYVLSNNSGISYINGATSITTDAVAFDVYDYYTAGGYTVPVVNVNTTGTIAGKIEVSESISNNLNIKDGSFTTAIAEAWCAEGYIPTTEVVGGITYYTVKVGEYVAQVGDKKFESFDEAFAYAKSTTDNDAITILKTIVLSADQTIDFENIAVTSTVNPAFRITDGANVTVENGNMNTEDGGYNFILGASDDSSAGNLTIESGKFHGAITVASVTMGSLNITGGEFSVEPYQGSYEFLINCIDANYTNGTASVAITGGTFHNWNPQNNAAEGTGTDFCYVDHAATEAAENVWTVLPAVAKIGEARFATLQDAVNAAQANETINLIANVQLTKFVTIDKSVNLNLGQFDITRNDGTALYVNGENIQVAIYGTGKVSGYQAVFVNNGIVTINGGNFVGNPEAVYVINNGHAVINDGRFETIDSDKRYVLNEYDATRDVTTINVYGGTFVGFDPENNAAEGAGTNFCAEGYISDDNGDGTFTVRRGEYVAQIAETGAKYETLQAAYEAANANHTIVLLQNVTLDATFAIAKGVTLNGSENNYKLTVNANGIPAVKVNTNDDVIFKNLVIESTGYNNGSQTHGVHIAKKANVTFDNVDVNSIYSVFVESSAAESVINVNNGSKLYADMSGIYAKGKVTINVTNSWVEKYYNGGSAIYVNGEYSVVNVVNSTIKATSTSNAHFAAFEIGADNVTVNVDENSKIEVINSSYDIYAFYVGDKELNIRVLTNHNIIIADGATINKNKETDPVIYIKDAEVKVTKDNVATMMYFRLIDALAVSHVEGETMTILKPVVLTENAALNIEGRTIITAENVYPAIRVQNDAEVTITGEGTIKNDDYVFVVGASDASSAGNLTIENGTYVGETTVAQVTLGKLNITGGDFSFTDVETYDYAYLINCKDEYYNAGTAQVEIKGGTFHNFNPQNNAAEGAGTNFCAEGYGAYESAPNVWTVRGAVARIGDRYFAKVADATSAAVTGDIVYLLDNVNDAEVTVDLNTAKKITIDLGDFTYTSTGTAFIAYRNGTELTITNGTVNGNGAAGGTLRATYNATLILGADLTVNAGPQATAIVIQDGKFFVNPNTENVIVNGGIDCIKVQEGALEVSIASGTYTEDVQEWCADGYVSQNNGDGTWTVRAADYVAAIGEAKYESLQAAIDAAQNNNTVTVIKSHELAETVIVNKNVNIDFATGVELTTKVYPTAFRITEGADVTVVNANIKTVEGGLYNFILGASDSSSEGNLTIKNGTFVANTTVASVTKGNLVIEGGDFSLVEGTTDYRYLINCIDANYNNGTATVAISGGTFHNWNPQDNAAETGGHANFCAEGYAAVETSTGVWEVVPMQEMKLSVGWNWFSSYIDINGKAGWENLKTGLGSNAMLVKNQNSMSQYYNTDNIVGWDGTLEETSVKEMYMIRMSADHDLTLTGKLVDPSENPITLHHNGWTWIGYQLNEQLPLVDALVNITPNHGDRIKSHQGFSQYYSNESFKGWWGTLENMTPGYGYMYYNANENDATLKYSYPADGSKSEVRANITSENNYWVPASSRYAGNMNIVAMLEADGDNYEIAAFVGGEVRGSARPIYVEPLDAYMFFLTVHGEDVEEMTFKVYDLATGEEYNLNDRMNYSDNAVVGSIEEPYIFRGTVGVGETSLSEINVYPNPTTIGTEINLGTVCDTVEVFNALGVKVAEYQNVDTVDALETAGIYVIRITNNGNVQNCRLIVK